MWGIKHSKICPRYKAAGLANIRCDTIDCQVWIGGECAETKTARALDTLAHAVAGWSGKVYTLPADRVFPKEG